MRRVGSGAPVLGRAVVWACTIVLGAAAGMSGQTIQPPYNSIYTLTDLGVVSGLPTPYGGLDFLASNTNVLVIGGSANNASGAMYTVGVARDSQNHVTGFTGPATFFSAGQFNDGGVVFGPGNVLFYTRYPTNEVGEVKPGSTITDKVVDLTSLGISGPEVQGSHKSRNGPSGGALSSVGALNFVPGGFPGAGALKIVSFDTGNWYTASYSPDGTGTYNITSAVLNTTIQGGPEGFIYVPPGSPIFPSNSMLVSEYDNDVVSTYTFDGGANPVPATRAIFINGLTGAEGAVIDPLTGDFLFSTFGAVNHVIVVRGFAIPPTPGPTPPPGPTATVPMLSPELLSVLGVALAAVALYLIRRSF
jgi:hypothetical protein